MTLQMCEEAAQAAIAVRAMRHQPQARPTAALSPLDADVLSAAIPAFFIGRNGAGLWVAREANGRSGGLFLLKSSAVDFANRQSRPARCALVFPRETFELDIENRGNPLAGPAARWLGRARRLLTRMPQRSRT